MGQVNEGLGVENYGLRALALPPLALSAGWFRVHCLRLVQKIMAHAASRELQVDTERIPLADIENVWTRDQGRSRLVIIP